MYVSIALMLCAGGITVCTYSRYQTNAVQVYDFMKTVWPQAYSGAALTRNCAAHLQPQRHV